MSRPRNLKYEKPNATAALLIVTLAAARTPTIVLFFSQFSTGATCHTVT